MAHPEIGRRILERLIDELADVAIAEIDAAAGRQPDAHDPEPQAAERRQEADPRRRRLDKRFRHGRLSNEGDMLKLKTHRGAAKRFKRTRAGKFLRAKAFKQHILSSKTTQAQARAARTTTVADVDAREDRADASV